MKIEHPCIPALNTNICGKLVYTLLILSLAHLGSFAQEDLNVVKVENHEWMEYSDISNALYHHFTQEAYQHLDKRRETVAGLNSLSEWKERQKWIRATLHKVVGPFPEKTPLNGKIVRVVKKDTYRVEHIVFESQPQFFVTSSLFIPNTLKNREKAPAIIYCSGHTPEGYRSETYQNVILNLVDKGFVVFAFDPVGQGERLGYYDAAQKASTVGGPTREHSYPGSQGFISGSSQARYMIWDGIRAVDYLLTRREVDPNRIGITGRSGGGTQSAYIAAFDERIKAAAPECYITNFKRLLQTRGPQDAEQNFMNGIGSGLDQGDLLLVRAPKPALMITTTRDIFSIQGARETAKEVRGIYKTYDAEENFAMVEDDDVHASTEKNREAMYAFFQKHLDHPGLADDKVLTLLTPDEIRVTPTGQLSTSYEGETIFSLNKKDVQQKVLALENARKNPNDHLIEVVPAAKRLSGFREPENTGSPVFTGRFLRDGYAIEKYFINGEGDYPVPYLLMVPDNPNGKGILYLHPSGKAAEASVGGEMESFVRNGYAVLAPDLLGDGELGSGDFRGDAVIGGVHHNIWYCSILIGRSIVGVQAGDIARLTQVFEKDHEVKHIYGLAKKEMTPVLLHAAAFVPAIQRVALLDPLPSYRSLVMNRFYHSPFIPTAVAGVLRAYDLPDLAASLAPRKLIMARTEDGPDGPNDLGNNMEDIAFIRSTYTEKQADGEFIIVSDGASEKPRDLFVEWLK